MGVAMAATPHPCERVLIVDDDVDAVSSIRDVLLLDGVPVVQGVGSVADADALLASGFQPSAIILDLLLDGTGGVTLAQRLRANPNYSKVAIIAVSGDHEALRRVRRIVNRGFLKPADPSALLTALREVCTH